MSGVKVTRDEPQHFEVVVSDSVAPTQTRSTDPLPVLKVIGIVIAALLVIAIVVLFPIVLVPIAVFAVGFLRK